MEWEWNRSSSGIETTRPCVILLADRDGAGEGTLCGRRMVPWEWPRARRLEWPPHPGSSARVLARWEWTRARSSAEWPHIGIVRGMEWEWNRPLVLLRMVTEPRTIGYGVGNGIAEGKVGVAEWRSRLA